MNKTKFKTLLRIQPRSGFTLVELMIVITIIVVLLSMTLLTVNFAKDADRAKSAARQIQSFLAGARDRAIYAREPRGVRFFSSPEDPRLVTTMAYIAPGGTWSSPENSNKVKLERRDINNDGDVVDTIGGVSESLIVLVHGEQNPGWWNLKRRGWLTDGLRIRLPKGPTGNWYPIDTSLIDITQPPTDDQYLILQIPYPDDSINNANQRVAVDGSTYEIELPARLLSQDPSILPEGLVIDLDGSKVPDSWRPVSTGNGAYSGFMDVIFSPRGNIVGEAAGSGLIHLYVCDSEDSRFLKGQFAAIRPTMALEMESGILTQPFIPMDEIIVDATNPLAPVVPWVGSDNNYLVKERRLVSVFTQTGAISIHAVNAYTSSNAVGYGDLYDHFDIDADGYTIPAAPSSSDTPEPDGLADDPYAFAESGKVAN